MKIRLKNLYSNNHRTLAQPFCWVASVVALLMTAGSVHAQQEAMYSQYMFNMLQVNPAYAGSRAADNVTMLYRRQWVGFTGAPRTASISWDKRPDESNVGYGLQVYNDQLGIEKTTGVQAFYSYHIPCGESYLALGLSGGVLNYRAAYSDLILQNPSDPVFQDDVNGWLPTAGFGVLYANPVWYVGFSVPALLHTKIDVQSVLSQSGLGANNHYFLSGGYIFEPSATLKIKPSIMIKAVKGSPVQADFNLNWWFNDVFGVGVSYRTADALVGIAELQISRQLRLGYSYDYTLTNLRSYNKGTHELMLRWELPGKDDRNYLGEHQDAFY